MRKIAREHFIYEFSATNSPIAQVASGDVIVFETCDCFHGQIRTSEQTMTELDFTRINPATGPVHIVGAEPGDVLEVEIVDIVVDSQAVTIAVPDVGLLPKQASQPVTRIVRLDTAGGLAEFAEHLQLPLRPMIGVIGVAPRDAVVPCGVPGIHGGNLDTKDMGKGGRLFLPVQVSGALLALGDVHALQGDGEVCGTGLECAAEVVVRVTVRKDLRLARPTLIKDEEIAVIGVGDDLRTAAADSLAALVDLLAEQQNLSPEAAYMLASASADLRICQVVNPKMTVRSVVKQALLPNLK